MSPSAITAAVHAARAALQKDDRGAALGILVEAWRSTRAERIGDLVETLGRSVADTRAPVRADTAKEQLPKWLARAKDVDVTDVSLLLTSINLGGHALAT